MTNPTVSDPGEQFWLASKPNALEPGDLAAYLSAGVWESPKPEQHAALLETVRPGDRIALKSTRQRKTGLPFFNADRTVSTMTIHAIGTVTEADPGNGILRVEWNLLDTPRDWYFWTYIPHLSRVDRDADPMRAGLYDFCFHAAPQDLDLFQSDSYWTTRYPFDPDLSWIPFYEALATRLLDFRSDRPELLQLLLTAAQDSPYLQYLMSDQYADGTTGPLQDIDPFTVMGTFNRSLTWDNRKQVASALGNALGVNAPLPEGFDAIPTLNNQKSWFIAYSKDRQPHDVDALWSCFEAAISLAADDTALNRDTFIDAFDAARGVHGVKWNLSQGLYWARPNAFVTLDARSRAFIQDRFGIGEPIDGSSYLEYRDQLQDLLVPGKTSITSFPLLSFAAWQDGNPYTAPHSVAGLATWATRMITSLDMSDVEHDYKRRAAAAFAAARDQAQSGHADWGEGFRQALDKTNTLDFRFKDDLRKAIKADPEGALETLNLVWADPSPQQLDAFQQALRTLLGKVTPGNATALGSLLLMGEDAESNAPYSPSRTTKWYALTGFEGPSDSASGTSRYATMLAFLDEFAAELDDQSGYLPSRLEAQGVAWATTENPIPDDWDADESKALQAWRRQSAEPARAWLLRSKKVTASDWLAEGYVSLAATNLGDVPPGSDQKTIKAAVESGYQHVDYLQRKVLTTEYHAFLTTMNVGDVVAVQSDDVLHIGTIDSDPEYVEDAAERLQRAVAWQATVAIDELPADTRGLLDLQGTVVDITQAIEQLTAFMTDGLIQLPPTTSPSVRTAPPSDVTPSLPAVTGDLADRLHMPVESLQEIVDLMESRQQIVLYGPPGTGKTFLAMALARHVVGPDDRSRVQLVQFHPSYAYEDFFEGFRPKETDQGQATFELTAGPLRRIAKDAKQNPDKPYVLVIDELNRANLAKVFGELYFLLEYRTESIQLQYNPTEAFQLPRNLFFIGTMNTADRSIALLDAAMRRRFSFVELHPDEPPVRDVLANWLAAKGQSNQRAVLLAALNYAIEDQDRDMRIGPSYLMKNEASTDQGLERVWKYDILPLLEEHYYGRLTRDQVRDRFGLDALLRGSPAVGESEPEALLTGDGSSDDLSD